MRRARSFLPVLLVAAAVAVAGFVSDAQSPGPALLRQGSGGQAAIAVASANRTQIIAQLALGQWSVVGATRACNASAFTLSVRQGPLRATAGVALAPLRPVTAPERAAIEAAIGPLFAAREREQGVDARDLSRATMAIEGLHAARSGRDVLFYFEASKRLHDARPPDTADADGDVDPRGIVRVTVSGWLRGGDTITPVGTKSELHWDPADEAGRVPASPGLEPLGVVVSGAEPMWVMRRAIGDRVSYLLYAVGSSTVRLALTVPAEEC